MGCLLKNTHTDGFIDPQTVAWSPQNKVAAFFECPDVFPLGDTGKYVILASLYNWAAGGYFVNSYFVGTIQNNQFSVESRGPLDYGQYYAARSGTGAVQTGQSRRVLFSATGWHNPPGLDLPSSCGTQMHLIPRDLRLDALNRLTFNTLNPIPELTSLHVQNTTRVQQVTAAAAASGIAGSSVELRMNCTGASASGLVGFHVLSSASHTSYVQVVYDFDKESLLVDHTKGGGPDSKITQAAPLSLDPSGELELVVLLDGALIEAFANRRAVVSSFATHVFGGAEPPEQRLNFVLVPPEGVTCVSQHSEMKRLTPL